MKSTFLTSRFQKKKRAKYIYDALTRNVQLWWDEFQHDRHSFAGASPINTCGLMAWLSIEEYYPNEFEEIILCMNQLFHWIYENFEEVHEVQSQENSFMECVNLEGLNLILIITII